MHLGACASTAVPAPDDDGHEGYGEDEDDDSSYLWVQTVSQEAQSGPAVYPLSWHLTV